MVSRCTSSMITGFTICHRYGKFVYILYRAPCHYVWGYILLSKIFDLHLPLEALEIINVMPKI